SRRRASRSARIRVTDRQQPVKRSSPTGLHPGLSAPAGTAPDGPPRAPPYPGGAMTTTLPPLPLDDAPAAPRPTYVVRTLGCQMNVHDSEHMAGMLEAAGYVP